MRSEGRDEFLEHGVCAHVDLTPRSLVKAKLPLTLSSKPSQEERLWPLSGTLDGAR